MLPPSDVLPPLSKPFRYSTATDLRSSFVIVWRVSAIAPSSALASAVRESAHTGRVGSLAGSFTLTRRSVGEPRALSHLPTIVATYEARRKVRSRRKIGREAGSIR